MIEFFVPGSPIAAGSKRAFPVHGRDGQLHVNVADTSGPRGREWRAAIRLAASYALDGAPAPVPLAGPLTLSLWFFLPRPKGHRGTRGLLPSAPACPTTRPDLLKMARAVEDALTGILWRDDAQIVDEDLHKLYDTEGLSIGVRVQVRAAAPMPIAPTADAGVTRSPLPWTLRAATRYLAELEGDLASAHAALDLVAPSRP